MFFRLHALFVNMCSSPYTPPTRLPFVMQNLARVTHGSREDRCQRKQNFCKVTGNLSEHDKQTCQMTYIFRQLSGKRMALCTQHMGNGYVSRVREMYRCWRSNLGRPRFGKLSKRWRSSKRR